VTGPFKGLPWNSNLQRRAALVVKQCSRLCPLVPEPDIFELDIEYVPEKHVIDTQSFRAYTATFHNRRFFDYELAERILMDIVRVIKPQEVKLGMRTHCGLRTESYVEVAWRRP
jgi:NADPH-dependent 7-cyano-7-deazaguanine reductase QueF